MLTGVYNGSNIKYYIDGVQVGSKSATGTIKQIANYLFIAAEAGAANATTPESNNFVGKISDVRIYATALSLEDIKELYQTSVSIDNKSNIYSREFIEDNNTISIQQNGQLLIDAV